MSNKDYKDIITGALFVLIGLAAAIYALIKYDFGTLMRMGPGLFPTAVGIFLAVVGLVILVPAFFRSGEELAIPDVRTFFFVVAALVLFAATVERLGLVPATVLLVVTSVLADNRLGWFRTLLLAAFLAFVAWLVFVFALHIPLDVIRSPWK